MIGLEFHNGLIYDAERNLDRNNKMAADSLIVPIYVDSYKQIQFNQKDRRGKSGCFAIFIYLKRVSIKKRNQLDISNRVKLIKRKF